MPCVAPLAGWFAKTPNEGGKFSVVFDQRADLGKPIDVPCGQCIGCRLEYARNWAVRCMHEASLYDENSFCTVTYDDEHMPDGGTLVKKDCQDFIKRLRSRFNDRRIRFYLSGEYGEVSLRPHYHMLLFGFDLPDKRPWTTRGQYRVWVSDILEETWGKGITEIGEVTFESAAYCARYMVEKFKGPKEVMDAWYDGLLPEFALMSRRPGIGFDYYKKYGKEIHSHDSVIVNGFEQKPPRYYDKLFEDRVPLACKSLKEDRKERAIARDKKDGRGSSRLAAEEKLMKARVEQRKGDL